MKQFSTPIKNTLYLGYRLIHPIFDPIRFIHGVMGYPRYILDTYRYRKMMKSEVMKFPDVFPILDENTGYTPFDAHYYYQQLWAFGHIVKKKPKFHVDIASSYQFSGYVATITKSEFVDIRTIDATWPRLRLRKADMLHLPYKNNSVPSLSCLHVLEHIGLGRYGDSIDPSGPLKASRELIRVLKKGGYLYLSIPIGRQKIYFNAHRVYTVQSVLSFFRSLSLVDISFVDDEGRYHDKWPQKNDASLEYGCGFFVFKK